MVQTLTKTNLRTIVAERGQLLRQIPTGRTRRSVYPEFQFSETSMKLQGMSDRGQFIIAIRKHGAEA